MSKVVRLFLIAMICMVSALPVSVAERVQAQEQTPQADTAATTCCKVFLPLIQITSSQAANTDVKAASQPPSQQGQVEVTQAIHQDVSQPLRNAKVASPSASNMREQPLRLIPPAGANT